MKTSKGVITTLVTQTEQEKAWKLLEAIIIHEGIVAGVTRKEFKVKVIPADCGKPRTWKVTAANKEDAMQIAFALDGGWSKGELDATAMLALAETYCSI